MPDPANRVHLMLDYPDRVACGWGAGSRTYTYCRQLVTCPECLAAPLSADAIPPSARYPAVPDLTERRYDPSAEADARDQT